MGFTQRIVTVSVLLLLCMLVVCARTVDDDGNDDVDNPEPRELLKNHKQWLQQRQRDDDKKLKKLLRQHSIPAPHYFALEENPHPLLPPRQRLKGNISSTKPTIRKGSRNEYDAALLRPLSFPQPVDPSDWNGEHNTEEQQEQEQEGSGLRGSTSRSRDRAVAVGVPSGVQRFIVLTTQRSGSGWLLHKLASRFPHIRADPSEPFTGPKHAMTNAEYNQMGYDHFRYFLDRTLIRRCGVDGWQARELACGFKFM